MHKISCTIAGAAILGMAIVVANAQARPEAVKAPANPRPAAAAPATPEPTQLKTFQLTEADADDVTTLVAHYQSLQAAKQAGRPGASASTGPRIAIDPRSKTLFVRGTAKEIETVGGLIAILENKGGQPVETHGITVVRLRNTRPEEVMPIVTALGLNNSLLVLRKANAIVIGSSESAKEVQEVIAKLDVEKKAEPKPAEKSNGKAAVAPKSAEKKAKTPQGGDR